MSTATEELPKGATEAVNEATRITREAARRGSETAKASIDAANSYLDEADVLGKDLFTLWSGQGEAVMKAIFDAQNASLEVSLALFDLGVRSNRQLMEQLVTLVRHNQTAAMESWQAAAGSVSKTFEPLPR